MFHYILFWGDLKKKNTPFFKMLRCFHIPAASSEITFFFEASTLARVSTEVTLSHVSLRLI